MGGWAIVLLVITRGEIGALLSGVVFADWIFFGLGAASVFALRRSRPDAPTAVSSVGLSGRAGLFVVAAVLGIISAYVSSLAHVAIGYGDPPGRRSGLLLDDPARPSALSLGTQFSIGRRVRKADAENAGALRALAEKRRIIACQIQALSCKRVTE